MSSTFIVTKREFKSNFDSPIGYVVIALSLLVVGAFSFNDFFTANRASLQQLLFYLPWALAVFVIPAITMRLFSEEKRTGTLELLITMPIRDREVVLGKYLASLGLIAVLIALTITYPISISWLLGPLDWGPVGAGYLGLLLYASASIAIGLYYSSITQNQVVALMLTSVTLFVLHALDFLARLAGTSIIGDAIRFISFQSRLTPFTRGLIDLRHVFYFGSVTAFFLMLTIRQLESRKWK
jgi:ABC-2 type transport system permease protein